MSYIGQTLPSNSFEGYTTDTFAGDGSATTFTMSKAPFNESAVIVVINNVIQQPTTNFTVSGTTLTIVGTAVASGDVIYATHTGGAIPINTASALDLNGASDQLILDADADTTISADTDDQIDIKIAGADDFQMTANTLTSLSGSTIKTNTIAETTSGSGVTIDSLVIKDQKITNWVGSIAQVVGSSVAGGNVSVTSTTYTDTGATVTITPQYATSKILVIARGSYTQGATDDTVQGGIRLVRNVDGGSFSNLVTPNADTNGPYETILELTAGGNINNRGGYYNYVFLDDPDTTTACIYKIQARPYDTANSHRISFGNTGGGGGGQSQQMVVMEILHGS